MRVVSFVILLFFSSSAFADDAEKLLGNWKLVSFFTEDVQTKQRNNVYGEHPDGFVGFSVLQRQIERGKHETIIAVVQLRERWR